MLSLQPWLQSLAPGIMIDKYCLYCTILLQKIKICQHTNLGCMILYDVVCVSLCNITNAWCLRKAAGPAFCRHPLYRIHNTCPACPLHSNKLDRYWPLMIHFPTLVARKYTSLLWGLSLLLNQGHQPYLSRSLATCRTGMELDVLPGKWPEGQILTLEFGGVQKKNKIIAMSVHRFCCMMLHASLLAIHLQYDAASWWSFESKQLV